MTLFEHIHHPWTEERKAVGPPKVAAAAAQVHGTSTVGRINSKIGLFVTLAVGTMWTAYLFTLLALVSLPAAIKSGDKIIIVAWISQTLIQLTLLPVIIVGQNIQAKAADARADATYKDAEAVLHEAEQIQAHLMAQDDVLTGLITAFHGPAVPPAPAAKRNPSRMTQVTPPAAGSTTPPPAAGA